MQRSSDIETIELQKASRKKKKVKQGKARNYEIENGPIWRGWRCVDDVLIDDAGNKYSQRSITRIYWTDMIIKTLTHQLHKLQPKKDRPPVQLELFPRSMYDHVKPWRKLR